MCRSTMIVIFSVTGSYWNEHATALLAAPDSIKDNENKNDKCVFYI